MKQKYKWVDQCFQKSLMAFMVLLMLFGITKTANAATDTTKPTLTVKVDTTDYTNAVTFTVKATDKSGIKEVKYIDSNQKTTYFKKNGIKLTLSKGIATVQVTENGTYTFYAIDKAGNTKIKRITIDQIDTVAPVIELSDSVMNQVATISVGVVDLESGIRTVSYLEGNVTNDSKLWKTATDITGKSSFEVTKSGDYTVKAVDEVGNETVSVIHITMELKAVWISYLEFSSTGYTEEAFTTYVEEMFDNVVDLNMNAVIVQVRPFGDAMYASSYFPWSKYISGTQGKNPGFDPLEIMIEAAHERSLEIHAWINPYRISTSTDVKTLADSNPAKKWLTDKSTTNDRNVLTFNGSLYYNPASSQVRKLIVNGVKEIVTNYDVDGIHFDDYFYPTLGKNYATLFDAQEYNTYVKTQQDAGKTVKSIADWRRGNVNTLIKSVYSTIKSIDSTVSFGVSPQGNIDNLMSDEKLYVDIKTWLSKDGYIDYIAPQIYWTFENSICPFDDTLDRWLALRTNKKVSMYVGIANYRAGSSIEPQWKEDTILADMVQYSRDTGLVDGFMFFRYAFFSQKVCLPAVNELLPVLDER